MDIQGDSQELLQATRLPDALQPAPPWIAHNCTVSKCAHDADGSYVTFLRAEPDRAAHLIQWCAPPPASVKGYFVVTAAIQALGEGAVGVNIYLYFHPENDADNKVHQLAHPGDGRWHTLTKSFPIPKERIHRMRVMVVSRSGDAPFSVRDVSLQFVPTSPGATPTLLELGVSPAFHAAVMKKVNRHPAAGDPDFRAKLYHSLITGNRKGRNALEKATALLRPSGFSIEGARFLDLGSGTGGALTAAKAMGARWAEGWEIIPEKLEMSRVNLESLDSKTGGYAIFDRSVDDPPPIGEDFEHFDLIFCQEVLEHVKDVAGTMKTIARCLHPERGAAYVTVPNGYALPNVLCDPHLHVFGISLLDRFEAQPIATALKNHTHYSKMMGEYLHFEDYRSHFEALGLASIYLGDQPVNSDAVKRCAKIITRIRTLRKTLRTDWRGKVDPDSIALLEGRVEAYLYEAKRRLKSVRSRGCSDAEHRNFVRDYDTTQFEFIVAHKGGNVSRYFAAP